MGNKKNKRGSIPGTASPTTKTELIERTPENDYGVLSDPEEGVDLNVKNQNDEEVPVPVPHPQHPQHQQQSPILNDNSVPISEPQSRVAVENDTHSPQPTHSSPQPNTPPTQSLTQQPSPSSTLSLTPPSSQQAQSPPSPSSPQSLTLSGRLTPSLPPPSPGTKSLKALQLKLTTDKNYTKKITLHTFFSYVVLAIEIERASSPSIARISAANVEKLVEYMIDNHAANEDIETYLNTLLKTDVIRNLITAVIVFNTDQAGALDKLLSAEQMEMEMMALKAAATTAAPDATAAAAAAITSTAAATASTTAATATDDNQSPLNASTTPTPQLSQTSRAKRFWNFLKCLLCGCCGGSAPQRRELRSIDQQASP